MRRRLILVVPLIAAAFLVGAACQEESGGDLTPDSTAPPNLAEGEVLVRSVSFTPEEIRVTAGETVTWRFDDGGLEHTVTADDGSFDSGRKASGTFQQTFSAPGTVTYHCTVHTRMKGSVTVS